MSFYEFPTSSDFAPLCAAPSGEKAEPTESAPAETANSPWFQDVTEEAGLPTDAVRPGQLILYHAWENYQFPKGRGFQNLIPSPLNPVELAGGQFHLRPMAICMQPSHTDRDTHVEMQRI